MSTQLLSIGQLIDQSWEIFRSRMYDLLSISGWLITTAILLAIALAFYPFMSKLQIGADLNILETIGVTLFSLTSIVIAPILNFWIYITLVKSVGAHLSRRTLIPTQAMRDVKTVFFPTLLTSIMVLLMILLAIVIGFAPPAIIAAVGSLTGWGALIVLANLLLIVGIFVSLFLSIKWVVHYYMAPYFTILDGTPAKLALAQSRQLMEGKFWSMLMRIAMPKLLFIILGVFAMSLIAYLVGILIEASAGLNLDIQLRFSTITTTIVPILIAVVINPLLVISDVLLLRSLR